MLSSSLSYRSLNSAQTLSLISPDDRIPNYSRWSTRTAERLDLHSSTRQKSKRRKDVRFGFVMCVLSYINALSGEQMSLVAPAVDDVANRITTSCCALLYEKQIGLHLYASLGQGHGVTVILTLHSRTLNRLPKTFHLIPSVRRSCIPNLTKIRVQEAFGIGKRYNN